MLLESNMYEILHGVYHLVGAPISENATLQGNAVSTQKKRTDGALTLNNSSYQRISVLEFANNAQHQSVEIKRFYLQA